MALSLKALAIFVLLMTLLMLVTNLHEEHILPHIREKRNVLSYPGTYAANIFLNASNVETYEEILSTLNATSYPLQIDNNTEIQDITVTT
ncbi:hypothetical protein GOODEAATRI_010556, partial [Goodea atripinnis]